MSGEKHFDLFQVFTPARHLYACMLARPDIVDLDQFGGFDNGECLIEIATEGQEVGPKAQEVEPSFVSRDRRELFPNLPHSWYAMSFSGDLQVFFVEKSLEASQ